MGYFKRRISRQRCAAQVAAAVSRQSRASLNVWQLAPATPPRDRKPTYLRFAVSRDDPTSHEALGVFQAAYELRDRYGKHSEVSRTLTPALAWFAKNLRAPGVTGRPIYWFKSDARDCIGHVWQLIHVLREHDGVVWMIRSEAPGMIRYEDPCQVAAIPFRSSRWRRRPV